MEREREIERQKDDRKTERKRDRETERQRDRETERQRDRETERQRDRETERLTKPDMFIKGKILYCFFLDRKS